MEEDIIYNLTNATTNFQSSKITITSENTPSVIINRDGTIIFNKLKFEENAPKDFAVEFLKAIQEITGNNLYEKNIELIKTIEELEKKIDKQEERLNDTIREMVYYFVEE